MPAAGPDWIVIHSMALGNNPAALTGEADFVSYKGGDWYLDKLPQPTKDPLKQVEAARRSVRGFLRQHCLLDGGEPTARLLWFTSMGRHQVENKTPGDMQFFEWHDELAKPVWLIEKVLDEHNAWFGVVDGVDVDPSTFTAERANAIADALLVDFGATRTKADERRDRQIVERRLLEEQQEALDLAEDNDDVYFDGPAGTGKSFLIADAARRFDRAGIKTLVTCWNVMMPTSLGSRFVDWESRSPT